MAGQGRDGWAYTPLAISAGVVIAAMLFYHLFKVEIITTLFWIKFYELKLISIFVPKFEGLIAWESEHYSHLGAVDWESVSYLAYDVGVALKYPAAVLLLLGCVFLWFFHPKKRFNQKMNMSTLVKSLRPSFPATTVVSEIDLVKQDIHKGPWKMALSPIDFSKKHQLLMKKEGIGCFTIDETKTKTLLRGSLGALWRGEEILGDVETFVFAVLCLFVVGQRDQAQGMLDSLCESASMDNVKKGALAFGNSKKVLKKMLKHPKIQRIFSQHAYINTVAMHLLEEARLTGIVANSSFLWLKPNHRVMWYCLNSVGRKAIVAEVCGIWAHYLAEKKLGYPLTQPMIDEAVFGLKDAIENRVIVDEGVE